MPLTRAQHEKSLEDPAVCELLKIRDFLDNSAIDYQTGAVKWEIPQPGGAAVLGTGQVVDHGFLELALERRDLLGFLLHGQAQRTDVMEEVGAAADAGRNRWAFEAHCWSPDPSQAVQRCAPNRDLTFPTPLHNLQGATAR